MVNYLSRRRLALACLSVCLCLSAKPGNAETQTWLKYESQGKEALIQSNYGEAERSFQKALSEAEKDEHALYDQSLILKNLGDLYCVRGQFSKAQPLYERSLKLKCRVFAVDNEDLIESFGQLAEFYMAHAQQIKADSICQRLVGDANTVFHQREAYLKGKLGSKDKTEDANSPKHSAEDINVANNECLDLAAIFDALGTAYKNQHKYLQAESLFKPALAIRQRILSSGHMAIAQSSEHLADFYAGVAKYGQAEPLYKHAYEIAKALPGPRRAELNDFTINLADCYMNLGKNDQALAYFQEAIANTGANSMAQCDAKLALAHFYEHTGRYAQAAALIKQALTIAAKANGPDHASLTPIRQSYAEVLAKLNHRTEPASVSSRAKDFSGM
jgi:tetratricopeptide (TPR) repeat protein